MHNRLIQRLKAHLAHLYPHENLEKLTDQVFATYWPKGREPLLEPRLPGSDLWSAEDNVLITYGDTIFEEGKAGLKTLLRFLNRASL